MMDYGSLPTTWQGWVRGIGIMVVVVVFMSRSFWWSKYKEKKANSWPKTFKSKSGQRYIFANINELHSAMLEGNVDYNAKSWPYGETILFMDIMLLISCKDRSNRPDETWIRGYISGIVQRGGNLNPDVNIDGSTVSMLGYAVSRGDTTVALILRECGARE